MNPTCAVASTFIPPEGQWFSPGILASSKLKAGCNVIIMSAESGVKLQQSITQYEVNIASLGSLISC